MRPPRVDHPDAWHHVFNRGVNRQSIFVDDHDRRTFLDDLDCAVVQTGIEVHAYCLMANHYHLLVRSLIGDLSTAMKTLSERYTLHYNRRHDRDGPLFRGRFGSVHVNEPGHSDIVAHYIHANPFGDGRIRSGYEWSSFDALAGTARVPRWLSTGYITSDHRRPVHAPSLEDIVRLVVDEFGEAHSPVSAMPRSSIAVRLILTLGRDQAGASIDDLRDVVGLPSKQSTSVALHRARQAIESDPELLETAERLAHRLGAPQSMQ